MSRYRITFCPALKTAAKAVECDFFEVTQHDYWFMDAHKVPLLVLPRDRVLAVVKTELKPGQFKKASAK